jgi:NAD(P)-dependent dehydrogenase (short-subunit alcohol dehydrogenase family)
MLTLKNRVVFFLGGSGNVGRGAVRAFCEGGMKVVMGTHMLEDAEEVTNAMCKEFGEKACLYISNKMSVQEMVEKVIRDYGSLDVLISNTGGFSTDYELVDLTVDIIKEKLTHDAGLLLTIREALPYLEKSKAGRIILTTGAGACNGYTGESVLDAMGRASAVGLTYYLARKFAKKGITVNCIEKSAMLNDHDGKEFDTNTEIPLIPMGRLGSNVEFGAAAAYFASEEAAFVTGQILHVSGGVAIGS